MAPDAPSPCVPQNRSAGEDLGLRAGRDGRPGRRAAGLSWSRHRAAMTRPDRAQNSVVVSSATRKVGVPPVEIDTACATTRWPEADAAAAWSAASDGKWSSAMR